MDDTHLYWTHGCGSGLWGSGQKASRGLATDSGFNTASACGRGRGCGSVVRIRGLMRTQYFGICTPLDRLRSTARRASVCSTTAVPQSPHCPLSEAETRPSRLPHAYSPLSYNGNVIHMGNLKADWANVDDGKWPHVAAVLNGRHTAGSVT